MLGLHKPENVAGSALPAILMGYAITLPGIECEIRMLNILIFRAFVAFGGVLYGYDTGTISGILAMKSFVDTFGQVDPTTGEMAITSATSSLVVSILSAGTFFGALSAGPLGDILGRRWGLIFAVFIVFNLGIILQMASSSIPLFVAGRFFAGLGVGMMSALVPLYQVIILIQTISKYCILSNSAIIVRSTSQMDPWSCCCLLSTGNYYRSLGCFNCKQLYPIP